jgi:hypothetical protein
MKYAPSALIGRMSRSAGSTTASHNRYGAYLRNRVIPTNPQTAKQLNVRASIAAGATAWKALTAAQRLQWTALGANIIRTDTLGQPYDLTGLQAFILTRRNLFTIGQAYVSTPAAYAPPNALTTFTMANAVGVITATWTPTPLGASEYIVIEATRPVSPGISFMPRGAYKTIFVGAAASASPQVLTAQYAAVFGAPPNGTKVFARAYVINSNGYASVRAQTTMTQ